VGGEEGFNLPARGERRKIEEGSFGGKGPGRGTERIKNSWLNSLERTHVTKKRVEGSN